MWGGGSNCPPCKCEPFFLIVYAEYHDRHLLFIWCFNFCLFRSSKCGCKDLFILWGWFLTQAQVLFQSPGSLGVRHSFFVVPSTALFWTEISEGFPGICWSLEVNALSAQLILSCCVKENICCTRLHGTINTSSYRIFKIFLSCLYQSLSSKQYPFSISLLALICFNCTNLPFFHLLQLSTYHMVSG